VNVFRHQHRVSYAECTVGNHVYYSRYLEILEKARGEFFRSIGMDFAKLQQGGSIFPVIELHIRYKAPARYDDLLTLELRVSQLGKVRVHFDCRIIGELGVVILEGETWHVCTDLQDKPKRIPQELAAALGPFLVELPG
jgi:acyl-CoA thioester hydrolase